MQVALQPSEAAVFPSSQPDSKLTLIESPQIGVQVSLLDAVPPVQVYPVSTLQTLEHPSPLTKLLSSQSLSPGLKPSPQVETQVSAAETDPP